MSSEKSLERAEPPAEDTPPSGAESTDNSSLDKKHNAATTPLPTGADDSDSAEAPDYATGLKLFLIMFTISISGLLTALEIGIIATAIPQITDEFHSLGDVGWYGSATFLVVGASSALWGKLYKYLNVKWAYLASIGIFLVGSIVAAAAPNSVSVIIGRAIQGLGISGTMSGSIIVINYVAHPSKHPALIGAWWGIFMISTILGPIVGGAFTSGVTWRWCFWINLPLGGPVILLLLLFLKVPKHIKPTTATWKEIILQLDIPGFGLMLASVICLTLALQWGGQTKPWSDGSVIATLVVWIVLFLGFIGVEWLQGDRAMVPLKLLGPRMTWANVVYCFVSNCAFYQVMFYLPIYFQSIDGQSAITSGVNTLPFLAFFALGAMLSGGIVGKTRLLQPFQLTSALLMTAGMSLLYTLTTDSSKAWYVGAEVLFGFGLGFGNTIPMTAVQGLSKPENVASSTGLMFMCQSSSGAYFIVIAQAVFANRLLQTLATLAPNLDPGRVLSVGASDIHNVFQGADLTAVLDAYMVGIKDVFVFSLAASAFAVVVSFIVPFQKLPDHGPAKTVEADNSGDQKAEEKHVAETV
ncbi:MFS gliotoxin efflux transporter glia [Cercophora scortea]|uniref:MFS gliotoxin efflux transporter glia n=1 Tax=Cercophora scortea TaxID=314031 RepID=A0AAE0M3C6_9PEZI|nr:MFS gliotoxin efflux transporter glia [Cercophora scortea]